MAFLVAGCAAGGDPGDGGAGLPDRGFGAYEWVVDAEGDPITLIELDGKRIGAPMAVVDAGRVVLYFELCDDDRCDVGRAESADGVTFGDPQIVAPDMRAPYLDRRDGQWILYGAHDDGVVRMRSDDGVAFDTRVTVKSAEGVGSPSVVERDGALTLFATHLDDGEVAFARSVDRGEGFGPWSPVEIPGTAEGWDPGEVLDPEVRAAETAAARGVLRVVYGGGGDLGFAASFDGEAWSGYAFNPALEDAAGPSNIRLGDRYLLYATRRRGGLGVAVRAVDNASERF